MKDGKRRTVGVTLRLALLSAILGSLSLAQQQVGTIRGRVGESSAPAPIVIEPPGPIANLFQKADEGIIRRDWKLAIDSLQRIIDDPEGSLMPRPDGAFPGGMRFESARVQATRLIATLPPEGLHAYRLLYDGQAKGLLERAKAGHDIGLLANVVDRFLMTRHGDDAAELLASWALDAGHPILALRVLDELAALVPDTDIDRSLIDGKWAVAYRMLRQDERARSIVTNSALRLAPAVTVPGWFSSLAEADSARFSTGGADSTSVEAPLLRPALVERVPWRSKLPPDSTPVSGGRIRGRLAIWDGSKVHAPRIIARTAIGCAAFRADDLSLIWEWPPPDSEIAIRAQSRVFAASDQGNSIRGSVLDWVTLGHNLVLSVVPILSDLTMTAEAAQPQLRVVGAQPARPAASRTPPGKLTAWDAATGEVRWSTGLVEDSTSDADIAEIRGLALEVGDNLWVPAVHQQELFMAVLRVKDGTLIRKINLCPVDANRASSRCVIQPTLLHGTVYVPTDLGLMFAIGVADFDVRWAARYPSTRAADAGVWVSSPPVVADGLVMWIPPDRAELLAFSSVDGEFRWSIGIDPSAQVLAGGDGSVVVASGARSVNSFSLSDGHLVWSTNLPAPRTGRAAVCGEAIYAPIEGGLAVLSLADGEQQLRETLQGNVPPLGNLACLTDSIVSLDGTSVHRYPDLARAYPRAVSDLESDPENLRTAVRVAWLELLRDQPQRALDVLAGGTNISDSSEGRRRDVRRILVEANLDLSERHKQDPARAMEFLAEAQRAATDPTDRLRCNLALATRLSQMDRRTEAHRTLWQLAASSDALQLVRSEGAVTRPARAELAQRLRELESSMSAAELEQVASWAAEETAEAVRSLQGTAPTESHRKLRALSDIAGGSAAQDALLALASWEAKVLHFEPAEQYLRECSRREGDAARSTEALKQLIELYLSPYLGLTAQARNVIDELETRFMGAPGSTEPSLQQFVRSMRERVGLPAGSAADAAASSRPYALTTGGGWTVPPLATQHPARLVSFDDDLPAVLAEKLIAFSSDQSVYGIDARQGNILWSSPLRLPGVFPEAETKTGSTKTDRARRALLDGQIGVFNGEDGLFAVGLVTGKRLWAIPYETSDSGGMTERSDDQMAVAEGMLAAMPKYNRLTLFRVVDGSMVWERDLLGDRVESIWMHGDRVIAADRELERVLILDRRDGRLLARVEFRQLTADGLRLPLVLTGGMLCGPHASPEAVEVIGVDVRTGQIAWRIPLETASLTHLFRPKEGYLGVSLLQGNVRLVSAETGEVVLDRCIAGGHDVRDGLLIGSTFLIRDVGTNHRPELHATDVATGDMLWSRADLALVNRWDQPLRVFGGSVPVMTEMGSGTQGRPKPLALVMLDLKTGAVLGAPINNVMHESLTSAAGDWTFRPGTAAISTGQGIRGIRLEAVPIQIGVPVDGMQIRGGS